ncbi:hypothetical protein ILUMI_00029 [Ignelater luminosus]|uniref:Chaoptin n=1 Tax=Ignelater luminosus TaxID=2038154 RepID=A0A8K0GN10_IGNLU|nr:hypothetical protein ILUMI_00029 [Ignelater luminosus]
MTGLKILNASHNQITKIPKNSFPKLYELHTIDLSYNNLSDIFNSVFQTLFSLRMLDLSHNSLETLKPSTFGAVPTLLELDLSYNQLRDIARSALTRLASMRNLIVKGNNLETLFQLPISVSHLDLSNNWIQELPPKFWPSMNSLLSLDLSYNLLGDNLVQGSFQNLLTLQKLNLNYNGITKPPWAALSDLTSLQYVYMEGNEITQLPRSAFGRLPVVFELNLAHNTLNNVSVRAFEGLLQLLVLNMTNNSIKHIPNGAFQGLVSLRYLDLSHNNIEKIDNKTHGLLDDCLSLEKVNLSYNKISFITRKTFPSNPYIPYKLNEIDLSYNSMPLITFDLVFGTAKLEKLNLSHNSITDIRRYVLGNLTRLKSLDLSYNTLEDLTSDKEVFILPSNLSELYLANNQLRTLPWNELKKPANISLLDLRNNNFDSFGQQLISMVNNKTAIYFEGNALNCDCFVRPLKRYFDNQLELKQFYRDIKCRSPPYLLGENLYEIPDDRLNCAVNVNFTRLIQQEPGEYDITNDLKIREFTIKKTILKIAWGVVKNDDIADPFVVIRDIKNPQNTIFSRTLPYFKRKLEVDIVKENITHLKNSKRGEYEICILARNSKASVRSLYKDQCKDISDQVTAGVSRFEMNVVISVMFAFLISRYL